MFKKVDQKQSFPDLEKKLLKHWDKNKIFEKSVKNREGKEKFVFFDGPPFANGLPHYGHILANCLKDAVTRYWTMKGYYVPRTNGWDCHGLPVEYEIEKELGLNGRKEILEYGIEKFNSKCRESVFRYTKEWEELLVRIARWVDFSQTYATLDNTYMESIWWVFKQIWEKDMVYRGYKSMHICYRCETPLSNFEVSLGYKDVVDLSITVKFPLKDEKNTYLLAWTTTPWTMPGHTFINVGPDIKYVKVEWEDNFYVVSEESLEKNFKGKEYRIVEHLTAKDLEGREYEPPFDYYKGWKNAHRVYVYPDVLATEGTGLVHMVPTFGGEEEVNFMHSKNVEPIIHVKMDGTFTDEVRDFAGKMAKNEVVAIKNLLEKKGLLFSHENYRHSYPHCWRCDTPLLAYLTNSWFIRVTEIKDRMLKNNGKIHWQPPHIQEGRFGKWLSGVRDWAISRNRFWGCPIPVWECDKCQNYLCIGSIDELKEKTGGKVPMRGDELDLHKPYIDEIAFDCECGGEMKRIPDVLDCWFESGSMPYAQLHYPFENKKEFEDNFPANFIAEGLDQTRGWFYTLHVLSTILFDEPAFKNVIVNGILLAADGEKLSKRKKNYPDPNKLFDTVGVDSVRLFLYSSTAPLASDVRFSENHVDEVLKKFTLTLWNTYSFFVTYANIDKFEPNNDFAEFLPEHKLDKWLLSELHALIKVVTEQMDVYNLTNAVRPMFDFVENLSNWYVRRSRRRFWKSENDVDKNQAYQTLYIVLTEFARLLAPFMPFMADEIYRNLAGKDSVHLEDWPAYDEKYIDKELNDEIHFVRLIVNLGHSLRASKNVKVRQPLKSVAIALPENIDPALVRSQEEVILEELNVKELQIIPEASKLATRTIKPDAKLLGPKYGKDVQFIIMEAKKGDFEILPDNSIKIGPFTLMPDEVEIGFVAKEGYDATSDEGVVVSLDMKIDADLRKEGYAREIVRCIQDMRKEADYNVDDRIFVLIDSTGELDEAVTQFSDYIQTETLANEIMQSGNIEWDKEREVLIDDLKAKIAIRR